MATGANRVRKYETEWTVGLTILAMAIDRQQDLLHVDRLKLDGCHLYLVTRQPRLSIHPESVSITGEQINMVLRCQHGESYDEFSLHSPHPFGPGPWQWISKWPYELFTIQNHEGKVAFSGLVGALAWSFPNWPPEAAQHDVLYVGQAYGQAGERNAWDRLKSHSTVQRILAEASPDEQIWLTFATISDTTAFSASDPRMPAQASAEDEEAHMRAVIDVVYGDGFKDKEAVTLAEAGLIRHFQPPYNTHYKHNFPGTRHGSLDAIRALDIHSLIIELQGQGLNLSYGSESQPYRQIHFAKFSVHSDPERAEFLSLLEQ